MDFKHTDTENTFRRAVEDFVNRELNPQSEKIDSKGEFPRELFKKAGELGYLGIRYPEVYGGSNGTATMFCILCEELARGSMSFAAGVAMQCLMGTDFIYKYGTEENKKNLIVPAIRGDKIGAFALTEPSAGSDLGAIQTTAVKKGNEYILNGSKTWITNAPVANFFTVAAMTDKTKGLKGINFFLVEMGTEGLSIGNRIEKLGVRGSETAEIFLNDCTGFIMGREGDGYNQLMNILSEIRTMTGALSIGLARAAHASAIKYSKERVQFGKPIGKFQAIKIKLADMATQLEAARLLVYQSAWMIDNNISCMKEASMAKLFASEMANHVADEASRIYASYGYSMEYPVQRYLRDARFLLIGGGTSEILKMVISREMGVD